MTAVRYRHWIQLRCWLLVTILCAIALPGLAASIQDDWQGVERIVAIGDIHGDYDNYMAVLKNAGVVNRRGRWAAGKTHVVQVGDIPDRGPDTLRIIEHLQKLEKQAKKAGGRLHLLIGNHEHMNITGDLRYVHPGEYEAFETRNSKQLRNNYYAYVVNTLEQQREALLASGGDPSNLPVVDDAFKRDWYAEHPLGFVEHRLAWQQGGELFEWIAAHNTVIRINDVLFLHGGLSAELLPLSITDINDRVRAELNREDFEGEPLGTADNGPLWYRGLARGDEVAERAALKSVLDHFGAKMIVLGHTPDLNAITPRFGGEVVIIDTGISAYYGGHLASLLIEAGVATAIHGQHRLPLPKDTAEILPYFEALAAEMPENPRLLAHVEALSNPSIQSGTDGQTDTPRMERAPQSIE
jgi:hypothetical protein